MSRPGEFHVDFLRELRASGGQISSARFTLQRGFLKSIAPLYVLTLEQGGVRSLQELPWSSDLEEYLLFDQKLRVATEAEEAERFAAILLNNLETAERAHGQDYARSVFVEILRSRPEYQLEDLLRRCPVYSPSRASEAYGGARALLEHSIDGLYNTAVVALGYDRSVARSLLTRALSIVLDEVFSITARDQLFSR